MILRPLISHDKEHIIKVARHIGTEDFSKTMPEYCGVISKSPTVKAIKARIEAEEANFDFSILDAVVQESKNIDIRQIAQESLEKVPEVEMVNELSADNEVILDIRSPDEHDVKPLIIEGMEIKHIPFYRLGTQFGDLPKEKTYLLYCERGVMSRLQALYLKDQGFDNIKVYRP